MIIGSGGNLTPTNYLDIGGATNFPPPPLPHPPCAVRMDVFQEKARALGIHRFPDARPFYRVWIFDLNWDLGSDMVAAVGNRCSLI